MVESTALEMRRAGNGTVGSNPTLSATHPANQSLNRVSEHNRRILRLEMEPFGSACSDSSPIQGISERLVVGGSPNRRWSVPFGTSLQNREKIEKQRVDRRFGWTDRVSAHEKRR